jgi:chromosome segregation ATPase
MEEEESHVRVLERERLEAFGRILLFAGDSEQVQTLADTYTQKYSEIRTIEEEKNAITRRICLLRVTNEQNRSHLASVTSTITSESTKYNVLCDSIDTLHESIVESFSQICTMGSKVDAIAIEELETKHDNICTDLEEMYERMREQESADEEAKNPATLLVPSVTLADHRIEQEEYRATCDKHTALQELVRILETEVRNKQDESEQVQDEIVSSQDNLRKQENMLVEVTQKLLAGNNELENCVRGLQVQRSEQQESMLLSRLDRIECNIDQSEVELVCKNEELSEVNKQIMMLCEKETAIKSVLSQISAEVAQKEDELAQICLTLVGKESDNKILSRQSSDLQKSLDNSRKENNNKEEEEAARLSKMRQDYAECEVALVEMQEKLKFLQEKNAVPLNVLETSTTAEETVLDDVLTNKKAIIQKLEVLLESVQERLDLKEKILIAQTGEIALSNAQHANFLNKRDENHAEYMLEHDAMRGKLDSQLEELRSDIHSLEQQKCEMLQAQSLQKVLIALPSTVDKETEACLGEYVQPSIPVLEDTLIHSDLCVSKVKSDAILQEKKLTDDFERLLSEMEDPGDAQIHAPVVSVDMLENVMSQLESRIDATQECAHDLVKVISAAEMVRNSLEEAKKTLLDEINHLTQNKSSLVVEIAGLVIQSTHAHANNQNLKEACNLLKDSEDQLSDHIMNMREGAEKEQSALQNTTQKIQKVCDQLQRDSKELKTEKSKLIEELKRYREEESIAVTKLQHSKTQQDQIQQRISTLQHTEEDYMHLEEKDKSCRLTHNKQQLEKIRKMQENVDYMLETKKTLMCKIDVLRASCEEYDTKLGKIQHYSQSLAAAVHLMQKNISLPHNSAEQHNQVGVVIGLIDDFLNWFEYTFTGRLCEFVGILVNSRIS